MTNLYTKIRVLRKQAKMSQEDLAKKTGYTDRSSIAKIESGLVDITQSKILAFAEALGVTPQYLMGADDNEASNLSNVDSDLTRIPIFAPISCGRGSFEDGQILDYVVIPADRLSHYKKYFGQEALGDSMIGVGIHEHDLLIFESCSVPQDGRIGCFCIDDDTAVCKTFKRGADGIAYLMSANAAYAPILIAADNTCFRMVGLLAFVINDRRIKEKE